MDLVSDSEKNFIASSLRRFNWGNCRFKVQGFKFGVVLGG